MHHLEYIRYFNYLEGTIMKYDKEKPFGSSVHHGMSAAEVHLWERQFLLWDIVVFSSLHCG
jgi:hypothetical protein